jgi:DNA-binding MarR family transcriptional regulator
MGEVVRDMVELGILEMTPDPADRRAKLVTYTEKGRRALRKGQRYNTELERRIIDTLGHETYQHLRSGLIALAEMLTGHDKQ